MEKELCNTTTAALIYSDELMIITRVCVSGEAALKSGATSIERAAFREVRSVRRD